METYFITGATGFIGSWIVKALIERGDDVIGFDCSDDPRRLLAIMDAADVARVHLSTGDITDSRTVHAAVANSGSRRIIHLAGLQVPACRTDPVVGAAVNVVGTLNIFEAARTIGAERIVYASSAAVYGASEAKPMSELAACAPATHYGVFKSANEGNARVYFLEHGLTSVGLRPLTVYGVGRDTGLTSDPTKAMKAAILDRPFHIRFSGATDFQYVADTAAAFIACADRTPQGAHVFNLHGETVQVSAIIETIRKHLPEQSRQLVTFGGSPIPFPPAMDDSAIRATIGNIPSTPLEAGVRATMDQFRQLRDEGRLDTSDIDG
ncbi:MAG TPA: NAD(P)-dependent oxidoreductase [Acidobacteriota bacterium]|jgi:nucleoside-diphosphate-sugar epimerase|nr:NAD(P)-dependent oxidoreductase [Acidobacteriota bacterium]